MGKGRKTEEEKTERMDGKAKGESTFTTRSKIVKEGKDFNQTKNFLREGIGEIKDDAK